MESYEQLKARVEKARQARDRSDWQRQQALDRLKEEYGCDDLEAAKTLHGELQSRLDELNRKVRSQYDELIYRFPQLG